MGCVWVIRGKPDLGVNNLLHDPKVVRSGTPQITEGDPWNGEIGSYHDASGTIKGHRQYGSFNESNKCGNSPARA